jgi:hypothetical protein
VQVVSRVALQIAAHGDQRRARRVPLGPAAAERLEAIIGEQPAVIAIEGAHSTGQLLLLELLARRHAGREVQPNEALDGSLVYRRARCDSAFAAHQTAGSADDTTIGTPSLRSCASVHWRRRSAIGGSRIVVRRTRQNPEYEAELDTIASGRRLLDQWSDLYSQRRSVAELVHFPMASFGGGRPGRSNLSVSIRHDAEGFRGGTEHRDPEWGFSLVDSIEVLQPSSVKGAAVNTFRRLRPDGTTYGIGINRLTIFTRRDGRWGFQIISSCGLRRPEQVYDASDEAIRSQVRGLIESMLEAYNDRDLGRLRACCNYPLVRLDRLDWSECHQPSDLSVDFGAIQARTGWDHSGVRYLEVLTPQSDDKVVVSLTVARYAADGAELAPEESIYLVTRQDQQWGVQASSTRYALGGLL